MRIFKIIMAVILGLIAIAILSAYLFLASSLPDLDGEKVFSELSAQGSIERDSLGTAVINASNQTDAAFLLGYAHAQDRLFQMDLLRKSAAGELSSIVGEAALERDKANRFYQFRQRAQAIVENLSPKEQALLSQYAAGVNAYIDEYGSPGFEFILTSSEMAPWQAADTILATFSMYIDLQGMQVARDFENTAIALDFGQQMLDFMYQPSPYQAAIDLSVVPFERPDIPALREMLPKEAPQTNTQQQTMQLNDALAEQRNVEARQDIGSNNWAVSGELTDSQSAMMSSDMHLGLNVPIIWYRTQLNYQKNGEPMSITGVSLPGTPLVIAGTNGKIAWGFTNSNVDNVDWIKLNSDTRIRTVSESIKVKDAADETLDIMMSDYGPVKQLKGENYALRWVALEDYAVNMQVAEMAEQSSVNEALALAETVSIPVQNMVIADDEGSIAWQLTGAITARSTPSLSAITEDEFDPAWSVQDTSPAKVYQPENQRVWSANARVISTDDLARYGDGGYALGARQRQIVDGLLDQELFDEAAFNALQLDNRALFLSDWHNLLINTLSNQPQKYAADIQALENWGACACADSIGYTLVRRFRTELIYALMAPVDTQLKTHGLRLRQSTRKIEGPVWQIIRSEPSAWLPEAYADFDALYLDVYESTRNDNIERYKADPSSLAGLEWGEVNALEITHPFAGSLGPLGQSLNMEKVAAFGDSFMPAVQGKSFGASQRLIVRPGNLDKAVLTVPGGQSMHPLSKYFDAGFDEYANGALTPLLPQEIEHRLVFNKSVE